MKKLSLILIIFVLSYSPSFAQNYSSEPKLFVTELVNDAIDKLSDKSLSKEEKAKFYAIQHCRFQTPMEIRIQYAGDIDAKKATLRKVYDKLHGKLLGAICSDRMKAWGNYKRNY